MGATEVVSLEKAGLEGIFAVVNSLSYVLPVEGTGDWRKSKFLC